MFDFVVVGAGSAGCVLANRLSADGRKVALIEAGPSAHRTFKVRVPGMYSLVLRSSLDWGLATEPQRHVDDRVLHWPRGKVLGGSSCLNAMVYTRGHRANYDEWRDLGNPGWSYADVLPLFKRSEDNGRGASEYHGRGGPLPVEDGPGSRVSRAFVEATAARCGVAQRGALALARAVRGLGDAGWDRPGAARSRPAPLRPARSCARGRAPRSPTTSSTSRRGSSAATRTRR